jgi:hypothetical protein
MKRVTTESGSVYLIDFEAKTWERVSSSPESGKIRTNSGTIQNTNPLKIEVGRPIEILTDRINPLAHYRLLATSIVMAIEDVDNCPQKKTEE